MKTQRMCEILDKELDFEEDGEHVGEAIAIRLRNLEATVEMNDGTIQFFTKRLRTLEAERALLLEVLRAAHEAGDAAFWGESETSVERVNYAADCLQRVLDACSHIEAGEKG